MTSSWAKPRPKSQVEQITIATIYKFMDDMNNETEELGGKAVTPKNPYAAIGGEKIAKENKYLLLDDTNLKTEERTINSLLHPS